MQDRRIQTTRFRSQHVISGAMRRLLCGIIVGLGGILSAATLWAAEKAAPLRFDRDTVIVWKAETQGAAYDFVVRIAHYEPKRLFEWESSASQGVVSIDPAALLSSRSFQTSKLFNSGSESRSKDETAIWLSKEAYLELARQGRVKIKLDSIDGLMTLVRCEMVSINVNKEPMEIPALLVKDSRGGEWLFYDDPENPFFIKHSIRNFTQTVKSITTNRKNTLRWLKENKIKALLEP